MKTDKTNISKPAPKLVTKNEGLCASKVGINYKGRPVLREVSLNLQRGEVVGLLGPNGAGKTTFFSIITGLIYADYGSISLDGHDITTLPMYRRARAGIGYLPQEASIFRGMTVEDNIKAGLEITEIESHKREEMLEALLAEFSISHLRRTLSIMLSGGERRRVEIARSLASRPSFILLDEPFAGVDLLSIQDIKALLLKLQARGCAVLVSDHNASQLLSVVDRAYVIANGTIVANGTPRQIVSTSEAKKLYFGEDFTI